ncbi:uncharacterized protein LOC110839998 [Zootermopsis nevadensis]|nr:uncharacterized protein LOC110839998 [Zootermopsis nevadensis]
MIDDQFVKLSHQSQSLTVDVSEMLEENTRKSSALWKELKANIDYYEEQVMREIDAMEQRFKFVDENLTEVTEQLTTHKLTEDEIIRDLEHRIDALNVEAEKRQRAWRFWEFVSSTNEADKNYIECLMADRDRYLLKAQSYHNENEMLKIRNRDLQFEVDYWIEEIRQMENKYNLKLDQLDRNKLDKHKLKTGESRSSDKSENREVGREN